VLLDVGGEIPFFTGVIIGISNFLIDYGILLLILVVIGGFFLWRYSLTQKGALAVSRFKLDFPIIGKLYTKLYLSRISDNLSTMLGSGIPMVRALEITAAVVGDKVYEQHLKEAILAVRGGRSVSESLGEFPEFPGIVIQMIKVGEETGELGSILNTLARFYRREVTNAVDTLVNLIEPIMIVALAVMVGVLLSAVLLPIYNISSAL
jgi:type IV pilus assembly protein PilC